MFDAKVDRRSVIGGTAAVFALGTMPAWAIEEQRANDPVAKSVQDFLNRFAADSHLPGLAGSFARGTDDAQFFATGMVGRSSSRAMDADSLFRIYSMTKPIVGMATMMLIEEGKIGLDQPLSEILPLFANPRVLIDPTKNLSARPASRPITMRHLLTHTAGLGYSIVTKGPLLKAYLKQGVVAGALSKKQIPGFPPFTPAPSLKAFADRLASLPLIADPGTRWSYSYGPDVLGRVIEVVSGIPLDQFLKARIFDPLGMKSTFFTVPASEVPRLTTNYGLSPLGKFPIDPGMDSIFASPPAFPSGGGGLVSSARDYDRFLAMLAGGGAIGQTRIMKPETVKLGMSNLLPSTADNSGPMINGQGFGAGGRVVLKAGDKGASIGSFGWNGAAATTAWVDPVRGIRAAGYAQFMPDRKLPFTKSFAAAIYAAL